MLSTTLIIAVIVCFCNEIIAEETCIYTNPDGLEWDVSKLRSETYYEADSKNYQSFKFYFNLCGPIIYEDPTGICPSGNTGVCEMSTDSSGKDDANEVYGFFDTTQITHSDGSEGKPIGGMLSYTGPLCERDDINLTANVFLVCDENADVPVVSCLDDDYWKCFVDLEIKSKLMCASALEISAGTDVGMILCILGFLGLFFYFAIGVFIMHKKFEKRGWERMPHKEFWEGIPALVKEGAEFSKIKVMHVVYKVRGKGPYEPV